MSVLYIRPRVSIPAITSLLSLVTSVREEPTTPYSLDSQLPNSPLAMSLAPTSSPPATQPGTSSGGPTFLEPTSAPLSPDPSQGHREQDLAWSRSSTPNSSSFSATAQAQPKGILQRAENRDVAGHVRGDKEDIDNHASVPDRAGDGSIAGETLEPEAATQAAQLSVGTGKGEGGESGERRGSAGMKSVRVIAAGESGLPESSSGQGQTRRTAGLTLPGRAAVSLESAEIQKKFISLYTNGTSILQCFLQYGRTRSAGSSG